jgi:MFS transporter
MSRRAPPATFFWLHWAAWPVGVIGGAMAAALAAAGLPIKQISEIVGVASLAFSLEIIWAPMVDSAFTRRGWCIAGSIAMCCCLASLLMAPWQSSSVPLLIVLAFCACSGAGIALVATKGIMAYDVPTGQLGRASGFYTAGGIVAKSVAGAGTLWLLAHVSSRPVVSGLSVGAAALAMSAILLASPGISLPASNLLPALHGALSDVWNFVRTRGGALVAVLCIIPFGTSTLLANAIAREWSVTSDQLSASIPVGAALSVSGAILAGRLSVRFGPWKTYIAWGWIMIVLLVALAFAPRSPSSFFTLLFLHRAGSGACYAALLGLVMTSIGKGAAATKAAALWSMVNFSEGYPAFIDGRVHDHAGTTAMLLTHAGMDAAGFAILLLAARLLGLRYRSLLAAMPAVA